MASFKVIIAHVSLYIVLWQARWCIGATMDDQQDEDLSFFMPQVPLVQPSELAIVRARAESLRDKAKASPTAGKAVAEALAAATCTLPPISLARGLRSLKDIPPEVQAHLPEAMELLGGIRGMGMAPPCLERPASPRGPPGAHRYLIASNLVNAEAIMPYWMLEVLRLGLLLQGNKHVMAAYFHNLTAVELQRWAGSEVHVSVYESGSTDLTPAWLEVADALWTAAGLRSFVVKNGSLVRGTSLDPYSGKFLKQHRIEFMASLRNAAMEPLYKSPRSTYSYVLFLNDVFFCAPDMLRLTHLKADISCGLDFELFVGDKKATLPGVTQRQSRHLLMTSGALGTGSEAHIGRIAPSNWHSAIKHMTQVHTEESTRQAEAEARTQAARVKPRYEFFDTWVSRDVGGNPFIKTEPIARDTRTIDTLQRSLPIPAKCCFNGAALINASLLHAGVRFRVGLVDDGECDISECSILCEDFRRLGARRVAVDPSVRVSYLTWTKDIHGRLPGGIGPKVPWSHVERSGALDRLRRMWSDTVNCMSIQCVPMRKGYEDADIHHFKVIDLRKINFTQIFLDRLNRPAQPPLAPQSCNLIMGPFGAATDGTAFDDLAHSSWGENPLTRISYRASNYVIALHFTYGTSEATYHGGTTGIAGEYVLQTGEYINGGGVYYDDTVVYGLVLETSAGRNLTIGSFPPGISRARGNPCPASSSHAGQYRLIAFAGTADIRVRSLTMVWS